MVAKLMKLLSGIVALTSGRPSSTVVEPVPDDLATLETKYRSLRDTNTALIRERRELQKHVQRLESMSDADRAGEHAIVLDSVRTFLQNRHGLNVSRSQVPAAVMDLSDRLKATGIAMHKLEDEISAWSRAERHTG